MGEKEALLSLTLMASSWEARSLLHRLRCLLFEPLYLEATSSQVCGSWHSMTSARRVPRIVPTSTSGRPGRQERLRLPWNQSVIVDS